MAHHRASSLRSAVGLAHRYVERSPYPGHCYYLRSEDVTLATDACYDQIQRVLFQAHDAASRTKMASPGQSVAQTPQPVHTTSSIFAFCAPWSQIMPGQLNTLLQKRAQPQSSPSFPALP